MQCACEGLNAQNATITGLRESDYKVQAKGKPFQHKRVSLRRMQTEEATTHCLAGRSRPLTRPGDGIGTSAAAAGITRCPWSSHRTELEDPKSVRLGLAVVIKHQVDDLPSLGSEKPG